MKYGVKIGIKEAREKKGITQIELAARLKVDTIIIAGWEAGASFPSIEILKKIACLLNTTTDMLLFSESRKPLDFSDLPDVYKKWIISFYKDVIKVNMEEE